MSSLIDLYQYLLFYSFLLYHIVVLLFSTCNWMHNCIIMYIVRLIAPWLMLLCRAHIALLNIWYLVSNGKELLYRVAVWQWTGKCKHRWAFLSLYHLLLTNSKIKYKNMHDFTWEQYFIMLMACGPMIALFVHTDKKCFHQSLISKLYRQSG